MNNKTKIPKIIHYMWLGDNPKSKQTLDYIEKWKKFNPDFEIIEWNEKNIDLESCSFVKEAFSKKKYAFVADWVRLYVLYKYGGIWLDTDVDVVKSFEPLMNLDGFLGFENEVYTESAIMASKKGSKYIAFLLEYYSKRHFIKKNKMDLTPNTVIQTIILHKYFGLKYKNVQQELKGELTVFENDYFAPKDYTTGKCVITDRTVAIHNFSNSWSNKLKKMQASILKSFRYIIGKRIFAFFTKVYIKIEEKKYCKEISKIIKKKQ